MSRRSKNRSGKKPNPERRRGQKGMGKKKYGRRQAASPPTPQKRTEVKAEKKVARERTRTGGAGRGEVGREPSQAELRWDANFARAERLLGEEGADWWVGMSGRDKSFGAWLQTQRQLRKSGRLRADRESRLESIGFVWDTGEALWERDFSRLAEHIGCCGAGWLGRLPEEEPGLASWCAGQRRAFRRGELSAERIRRLEGLGLCVELRGGGLGSALCRTVRGVEGASTRADRRGQRVGRAGQLGGCPAPQAPVGRD